MIDRVLAALVFSGASALLWLGYFVIARSEDALFLGLPSTAAAATVAAVVAPRLAVAAIADKPRLGVADGLWITVAAYLAGALVLATRFAVAGTEGLVDVLLLVVGLFLAGSGYGIVFLIPALFLGMAAGWLLFTIYQMRADTSQVDTQA